MAIPSEIHGLRNTLNVFFLHASFESQVIRAPSLSPSCCYSLAVKSLEYFAIVPGYDFHTRVNKS